MTQHWRKLAAIAYGYSITRLALNYYTYFEDAPEEQPTPALAMADREFHEVLGAYLSGDFPVERLKCLRERLREEMETLTAYVDGFRIYEYALNRMERRFHPEGSSAVMGDDILVEHLVRFVTAAKAPAEMNWRIQQVIGQLPVRFTRQKFYSMVKESLLAYVGSDQSSLDQMIYLLRSGAMAERERLQTGNYEKLAEAYSWLCTVPFQTLDADGHQEAMQRIGQVSDILYEYSDAYQMLEDMVNDLLVICLTDADAVKDQSENENALAVIRGLYEQDQKQKAGTIAAEITDRLTLLEGVQERYYDKYQRIDGIPRSAGDKDETETLARCVDKLLSDSPFASLEETEEGQTVGQKEVEAAAEDLTARMDPVLSASARPVARAVMANVLSNLPVSFQSLDEVRDYFRNSLAGCTDLAEKETSAELLQQMMENEGYAMV